MIIDTSDKKVIAGGITTVLVFLGMVVLLVMWRPQAQVVSGPPPIRSNVTTARPATTCPPNYVVQGSNCIPTVGALRDSGQLPQATRGACDPRTLPPGTLSCLTQEDEEVLQQLTDKYYPKLRSNRPFVQDPSCPPGLRKTALGCLDF